MAVTPPNPSPPPWLPYVGLALAVCGMIYQGGVLSSTVATNSNRITKLEAQMSVQVDTINQINVRSAGNQAKLDFLVDTARKDQK